MKKLIKLSALLFLAAFLFVGARAQDENLEEVEQRIEYRQEVHKDVSGIGLGG